MRTGNPPTLQHRENVQAMRLLYNRLNRAFTIYFWMTLVHPMLVEHRRFKEEQVAILVVKNACVETALMSIRDVDDFFRARDGRDRRTDLRACDFFNYTTPGPFLSPSERESINQWLAHLTSHPVVTKTAGVGGEPSREWNTAELVGKAARAVFHFFDYVQPELERVSQDEAAELVTVKKSVAAGLKNMEALAAFEVEFFSKKSQS